MAELEDDDTFDPEDLSNIMKESIDGVLQDATYTDSKVGQWNNAIVEACIERLTNLDKAYKYVVTCIIMQKNGAGLHTATSCYWDNSSDGALSHMKAKTNYRRSLSLSY